MLSRGNWLGIRGLRTSGVVSYLDGAGALSQIRRAFGIGRFHCNQYNLTMNLVFCVPSVVNSKVTSKNSK